MSAKRIKTIFIHLKYFRDYCFTSLEFFFGFTTFCANFPVTTIFHFNVGVLLISPQGVLEHQHRIYFLILILLIMPIVIIKNIQRIRIILKILIVRLRIYRIVLISVLTVLYRLSIY